LFLVWFLVAIWLWFEGSFLHKYVGLAGCGCGAFWGELVVVKKPITVLKRKI
jgi:hypothetical protein